MPEATTSTPSDEFGDDALIHLEVNQQWSAKDLAEFLQSLRFANASMIAFLQATAGDNAYRLPATGPFVHEQRDRILQNLWPDEDLLVASVYIASPGWLDVVGKLNPLTFIKDVIVLIRDWKQEREKGNLQNEHLRIRNMLKTNTLIKERLKILKNNNFSDAEIKALLLQYLGTSVTELQGFVEKSMVTNVEIRTPSEVTRIGAANTPSPATASAAENATSGSTAQATTPGSSGGPSASPSRSGRGSSPAEPSPGSGSPATP